MEYTFNDIIALLEKCDENENLELKESFRADNIGIPSAAFATTKGGKIIIGITEDKSPKGIIYEDGLIDKITNIIKSCKDYPIMNKVTPIKFNENRCILFIEIEEGNFKPYGYKGIYYKRENRQNTQLKADEITQMRLQSENISFCKIPAFCLERKATVNDVEENKLRDYISLAQESRNKNIKFIDAKQLLRNLDLLKIGEIQPLNGAILMFGKNPQKFIQHSKINLSIFPEAEIDTTFKKYSLVGDIVSLLNQSFNLIMSNIQHYYVIKELKRIEFSEYPKTAIREALINAIVHRDYFVRDSEIFIKVFKDRIEITNPGGIVGNLSLEEIKEKNISKRRNPIIAELLDDMGFMERSGRGIETMINAMKEQGLKEPLFDVSQNWFKITFFGATKKEFNKIIEKSREITDLNKILNQRQLEMLKEIRVGSSITSKGYSKRFKINIRTAQKDLNTLVKEKLFESKGSTKSGISYYKIVEIR